MKIFFAGFLIFFSSVQSLIAQNITSQELSKLSADINALQIAADGKTLIDPDNNSSSVVTFPKESFNVFFSSGFAYQAVYRDGGTDQLFVTENIDFSLADKITVMPVNNKSGVQCIRVNFRETVATRVMENGKEISTNYKNVVDFYCAAGNTESKNKLKTGLETLIGKLEKSKVKYRELRLGKWVTEPVAFFGSIGAFKDGLAKVSKGPGGYDDKWGYINTDGKIVVPVKYDGAMDFSSGLACVTLNNKTGFINRTGKVIIPFTWDYAGSFSEGLAIVEKNDKRGCIDTTGKIVLAPKFDNLHRFINEGLICFEDKNKKWGFVDRTGKIIIEPKYSSPSLGDLGVFKDGICMMQMWNVEIKSFKYGFLNKEGEEIIGLIYDDAKAFSEDLACVKMDKQYGYINKEGKVIIPFEYDFAYSFVNGLAQVKQNGRYGIINKKGEVVAPIRYLSITNFTEGIANVRRENLTYGFINEAGKEIITTKYEEAGGPKNGLIAVSIDGKWGYIDLEGNTRIPFIYDKAYDFIGGLAEVVLNGKPFIIDRSGNKWIAAKSK